jgi:hypothetical protein
MTIEEELKEIITRNNIDIRYKLDFPQYKILPEEVRLALMILEKHGMKIVITYEKKK